MVEKYEWNGAMYRSLEHHFASYLLIFMSWAGLIAVNFHDI